MDKPQGLNCHEIMLAMGMIDRLFIHANKIQLLKLQEYYDDKLYERCEQCNK